MGSELTIKKIELMPHEFLLIMGVMDTVINSSKTAKLETNV